MTRKRMVELVAEIQERMLLGHWRIDINFDEPPVNEAEADITRTAYYDVATLRLAPDWKTWSEPKTKHRLVHEFGHLVTRGLEEAVFDLQSFFKVESTWQMFFKRYQQEIEGVVDRYASVICGKEAA